MNSARTHFSQKTKGPQSCSFERGLISWLRLQNLLPNLQHRRISNPEREVANGYAQDGWLLVRRYPL